MAIFESTAFLSLKKSFGNVTTYRSRGINVLRMKTKEIRDPRTSGQRIRRVMLAESARLSCGFQAAHRLGFPKRPLGETTFNTFVRLNMAAVKVDDGLTVATDFSALVCSQGSRKVPAVKVTLVKADRQVLMSAEPGGFGPDADVSDVVFAVLYESGLNTCEVYELGKRSELGTQDAVLPENWDAGLVHAYAFVRSASKRISSETRYITVELQ